MNNKFKLAIIVVVSAPMVAAYLWYKTDELSPEPVKENMSYYEIVKEDEKCADNCFLEYIVMSDGVVMEKYIKDFNNKEKNGIRMLNAGVEVEKLFEKVALFFNKYGTNDGISCESCSSYHLYYSGRDGRRSFATIEGSNDSEVVNILSATMDLIAKASEGNVDFFHFYYGKKDGGYLDYHIFTDGVIIREVFGKRNGQLLESDIYRSDGKRIADVINLTKADFFNENSEIKFCNNREFLWGYLEVKTRESYNYIYTCGDGKNDSDIIFDYLYNNFE